MIEANEYLRPWKLLTFSAGLGMLIGGSYFYRFSDWDVGVSIVMAGLTYLTARGQFALYGNANGTGCPS